jgi:hypothetical protein
MIIIKTTNGDRFINEAETLQVSHNKDKAEVEVWPSRWGHQQQIPEFFVITHVEQVIYTTAPMNAYTDVGSELEAYKKELGARVDKYNELKHEYLNLMQENEDMKKRLEKLEPKADPDRWWSDEADRAPVSSIIVYGITNDHCGYAVRLDKIFDKYNIKTVGDLLRIGRKAFKKYRNVGGGSIHKIDRALEEMYNIKGW